MTLKVTSNPECPTVLCKRDKLSTVSPHSPDFAALLCTWPRLCTSLSCAVMLQEGSDRTSLLCLWSEVVPSPCISLWSMVGETKHSSGVMPQGQEMLGGNFDGDTGCREANPRLAAKSQVRKELLAGDLI